MCIRDRHCGAEQGNGCVRRVREPQWGAFEVFGHEVLRDLDDLVYGHRGGVDGDGDARDEVLELSLIHI